jgi:hypothetical protein
VFILRTEGVAFKASNPQVFQNKKTQDIVYTFSNILFTMSKRVLSRIVPAMSDRLFKPCEFFYRYAILQVQMIKSHFVISYYHNLGE